MSSIDIEYTHTGSYAFAKDDHCIAYNGPFGKGKELL